MTGKSSKFRIAIGHIQEYISHFFSGSRPPLFIPSVFCDPEGLAIEQAQGRTRKMEAGMFSVLVHVMVLSLILLLVRPGPRSLLQNELPVFINNVMILPIEEDGLNSGGGGGGKNRPEPASFGRLPQILSRQLLPPDPADPQPLVPTEDLFALSQSVQIPIDIPQDQSLSLGDITSPFGRTLSSGSGKGGGIGNGDGTGVGPGTGPGAGPGSNGGIGGGPNGDAGVGTNFGPRGIGAGVKPPEPLVQPLPDYTEQARKVRAEGVVLLQAVIRKDGRVDNIKVLRGLGYGLDESAMRTISSKWRFRPATLNGVPVDVQVNIEVAFRLY
jgi:periplasmic protein TonB